MSHPDLRLLPYLPRESDKDAPIKQFIKQLADLCESYGVRLYNVDNSGLIPYPIIVTRDHRRSFNNESSEFRIISEEDESPQNFVERLRDDAQ